MTIRRTALFHSGKNPAVEVGTEIVFNCPEGYFFEHDIYAPTKQKIRCTDSGQFRQPDQWFKCLARKFKRSLCMYNLLSPESCSLSMFPAPTTTTTTTPSKYFILV